MKINRNILCTTSLVICLVVIGVGIYFYISQKNSLDAANQDLTTTKQALDTTNQTLDTTKQELATTKQTLDAANQNVANSVNFLALPSYLNRNYYMVNNIPVSGEAGINYFFKQTNTDYSLKNAIIYTLGNITEIAEDNNYLSIAPSYSPTTTKYVYTFTINDQLPQDVLKNLTSIVLISDKVRLIFTVTNLNQLNFNLYIVTSLQIS